MDDQPDTMGTPGTDGTATFTYDKVGRITGFDSPLGGTSTDQAYGWQKVPNRDSLTIGTGSPVTTTYDAADRPTSSGSLWVWVVRADAVLRRTGKSGTRDGPLQEVAVQISQRTMSSWCPANGAYPGSTPRSGTVRAPPWTGPTTVPAAA